MMDGGDDPRVERQRLVARLIDLQQEMVSDPGPETKAQLLQTRQALQQLDGTRSGGRAAAGPTRVGIGSGLRNRARD
jgi:hypothetical protein